MRWWGVRSKRFTCRWHRPWKTTRKENSGAQVSVVASSFGVGPSKLVSVVSEAIFPIIYPFLLRLHTTPTITHVFIILLILNSRSHTRFHTSRYLNIAFIKLTQTRYTKNCCPQPIQEAAPRSTLIQLHPWRYAEHCFHQTYTIAFIKHTPLLSSNIHRPDILTVAVPMFLARPLLLEGALTGGGSTSTDAHTRLYPWRYAERCFRQTYTDQTY